MRITACVIAVFCAAAPLRAQDAIEWSPQRGLAKTDFKGRVPPSAPNASMSAIAIDTSWACEGGRLVASARATFDPSRSWWRPSLGGAWEGAGMRATSSSTQQAARLGALERDVQLLEHEQLHFDIAEVVVRKIRDRFTGFTSACGDAGATTLVRQMIVQADRELQDEQQRYDRETRHGVDVRAQDRWKRRIKALVK